MKTILFGEMEKIQTTVPAQILRQSRLERHFLKKYYITSTLLVSI